MEYEFEAIIRKLFFISLKLRLINILLLLKKLIILNELIIGKITLRNKVRLKDVAL